MFKTKDENLAKNEMEKEERRKNKLNTFDVLQEDKIRRQKKKHYYELRTNKRFIIFAT